MNNQELLLETWAEELQEFENAAFTVLLDVWLDTAVGVQLDGLGTIVGKERLGSTDATYRLLLRAQVRLNRSSGTVPDILNIISSVAPGVVMEFRQEFPAGFEVLALLEATTTETAETIASVIGSARVGGVRGLFQYYSIDPVFRLDGVGGSKFDGGYFFSATIEG